MMTVTRTLNGNSLEFTLRGKLDSLTAPKLAAELEKGMEGADSLLFDFSGLEYISSAGFRLLIQAENMLKNGEMRILYANDLVRNAFALTGLSYLLSD